MSNLIRYLSPQPRPQVFGKSRIFTPPAAAAVNATVTAVTVSTVAALPAPTKQTGSTVTAVTVVTTTALPAPTVSGAAAVAAVTIATAATLPAPTIQTGSRVTAIPVATVTAVGVPAVSAAAVITVVTVATVAALPAPTIRTGSTVTAVTVAAVTVIPTPTIDTGAIANYTRHVAIAAPRNGGTTHTVHPDGTGGTVVDGSAFTPNSGRFLLCLVEGGVTSTTPTGWTLPTNGSAINNTGLYVFYRASASATSADQVATTHNASDYQVIFDFYEFETGTAWVDAASATGG